MRRFLLLDIGAGTMDVLYYDHETGLHYKAVAKSPVLYCAEEIEKIPGDLLVTGYEMGGGSISGWRRVGKVDVSLLWCAGGGRMPKDVAFAIGEHGVDLDLLRLLFEASPDFYLSGAPLLQ